MLSMRLALAAGVAVGCLAMGASGQSKPKVAIVAAAANTANEQTNTRFTDPRDKLMATGLFESVTIISTTPYGGGHTPTLDELLQFDAVLTWTNDSHEDSVGVGNVMADYADAGGGVVVAVFTNTTTNPARQLLGRWMDEQYYLIEPASGFRAGLPGGVAMGTKLEPDHPILEGVETFRSASDWVDGLGYWGAFRPVTTTMMPGAYPIVLWEDGALLCVVSDARPNVVELGMHPVSSDVNHRYYWDSSTDGGRLMANALLFAAGLLSECGADCNGDTVLNTLDVLCFLNLYTSGDPGADCNGDTVLNTLDVLCFLNAYTAGCP